LTPTAGPNADADAVHHGARSLKAPPAFVATSGGRHALLLDTHLNAALCEAVSAGVVSSIA
jgi:hypothetical protein